MAQFQRGRGLGMYALRIFFLVTISCALHDVLAQVYDPIDLITPTRFDNMAKYIYAKYYNLHVKSSWPAQVYLESMRFGCNMKDRISNKYGDHDFIKAFNKTIDSIQQHGFDPSKSTIVIGQDGDIVDGAHRLITCLLFGHKVVGVRSTIKKPAGRATFFRHNGLGFDEKYLDFMAVHYCEIKKNTYIALTFSHAPACVVSTFEDFIRKHGEMVYEKKVHITQQGLRNLFLAKRLWGIDGDYDTTADGSTRTIKISLFECYDPTALEAFASTFSKQENLFFLNTHSDSTLSVARMLFNNNSINFLNNAEPETIRALNSIVETSKTRYQELAIHPETHCFYIPNILSHMVRATLDVVTVPRDKDFKTFRRVEVYDLLPVDYSKIVPTANSYDDIIFNPLNYFYFNDVKFAVPSNLRTPNQLPILSDTTKVSTSNTALQGLFLLSCLL